MEISILRILMLKLRYGSGLAMHGITHQVMPSENLMQDDAVGKAAKPHAENKAGPHQWVFLD